MENDAQTVGKGDLRRPRYPNIDIPGNHRGFSNGSSYLMKSRVQTCEPPTARNQTISVETRNA